jgi:hypothetical protein
MWGGIDFAGGKVEMPRLIATVLFGVSLLGQAAGAHPEVGDDGDRLWSLRRLKPVAVPSVDSPFARSPMDAFVVRKLTEENLHPSTEAGKRVLIRRATFDLTGLPPTPEEFANFVADESPDAYERLTDRLLASPHVGERWARHWMDVAHFAETHGHDQDRIRPNAWPYRDYLIDAFNEDRPYPRFVQDQVAGDVLFADDPSSLIATGFLASGPWDESSLMSIQDDTDDRKIAQYVDRDDILTTVMGTFASLTVHCARCHDHKFDPIPQADYYALQAVFAGVDKGDRGYDGDLRTRKRRGELRTELAQLDERPAAKFLDAELQARIVAWEKKATELANLWRVATPAEFRSANGSQLVLQPDGSVLSTGKKPEKDTYTLTFRVESPVITGLRLEALTDESLFKGGPGRQDNGNLHLSEIRVEAAPLSQPDAKQKVTLANPRADFDQQGWTIQQAIDGNPETAWGIHPEIGKPHRAVFEFAKPLRQDGGALITVTLEQLHGSGHLIGRPRIAFTSIEAPLPLDVATLPAEVAAVVAIPQSDRSDEQRAVLGRFVRREELQRELGALPPQQMVFTASNAFEPNGGYKPSPTPRLIHMLHRGDIKQPRDEAKPGALACVPELPSRFEIADLNQEGQRRAALAQWLTESENAIVWRSIVNRMWYYHFGRGLCDTPNDFGVMASEPSHPELLDWLAADFRDHGGSLKRLHRQLITSATYRQVADHRPEAAMLDGDNRLLWRSQRRRLEAEEIRDAALVFAGRLDNRMGGPSARQFIESPGVQVTPTVDYLGFDADKPEHSRRSVYRFLFRTLPDPYHEALDCPDSSQWAPVRNETLTALQALALLHDRVMIRQSEHLAERLAMSPDLNEQIGSLYRILLLREPTAEDLAVMVPYAKTHGLANACRMLLNSNEFLYVD